MVTRCNIPPWWCDDASILSTHAKPCQAGVHQRVLTLQQHLLHHCNMSINRWIEKIAGTDVRRRIAAHVGMEQSTLNRQMASGEPAPETVVRIARAYGASPVEGLTILGLINESEVQRAAAMAALESASDQDIVAEVLRRLESTQQDHPEFTEPVSEANVTIFQAAKETYPPGKEIE